MTLAEIRQRKAAKTAEARALLAKAETENRALNADESAKFDTLKSEITDLEAQEQRLDRPEFCRHSVAALRVAPFKLYR